MLIEIVWYRKLNAKFSVSGFILYLFILKSTDKWTVGQPSMTT